MTAVYTRRLLSGTGLERITATVPPGFVWVVRDVAIANTGGAIADAHVAIMPGHYIFWTQLDPAAGRRYAHWDGRQAMGAGEELEASGVPATCTFLVTGYVFEA